MNGLLQSIKQLPDRRSLFEVLCCFLVLISIVYFFAQDLIDLQAVPEAESILLIALVAFFVPALLEEVFFRGILLSKFTFPRITISMMLFILWHPLQALIYLPAARYTFFSMNFLFIVFILGVMCSYLYYRSRSIWTPVILHWIVVVLWKYCGGARFIF